MASEVITRERTSVPTPERAVPPGFTGMPRSEWIVLAAITAFGATLRLYHLGARSLWFDEGFGAGIALTRWPDFLRLSSGYSANMAFYYLLLKLWMPLGNSDAWTRGLSALFGIVSIPLLYWLARKLFGTAPAICAALLLTCNAFHVRYSQEARAYSLVPLLVILSVILLLRAVERSTDRAWLAWALVAALAVYAHAYAVLAIGPEILWAWFAAPEQRRRLFAACRWFVMALVPYVVIMTRGGTGAIAWLPPTTLPKFADTLLQVCGNAGWPLLFLLVAGAVAGFWVPRDERRSFALAACLAILPFVEVAILSQFKPLLNPRYMIIALPGIALMASAAAARMPRWITGVWIVATLAVSLGATYTYFQHSSEPLHDWRQATAFVLAHRRPNDRLTFFTWEGTLAFHYYWWQADHAAPKTDMNDLRFGNIAEFLGGQSEAQRQWVVLTHFDGNEIPIKFVRGWFSKDYTIKSSKDFTGLTVIEYEHK